jgi:quercetin dioxygenase-like cupin family protein
LEIVRGRKENIPSEQRGPTFTGEVWADPALAATDGPNILNVFFTPGARTHWHSHEHGQLLHVTTGSGFVCAEGDAPHELGAGDIVWAPAGEKHWHGAGPSTALGHLAVSFGTTSWHDPVTPEEYGAEPVQRFPSQP